MPLPIQRVSRRFFLRASVGSAASGAFIALSGCAAGQSARGNASTPSATTTTASIATADAAGLNVVASWNTSYLGGQLLVEVSSAVSNEGYTVVPVTFSTSSTTPIALQSAFDGGGDSYSLRGVRLLSLNDNKVWRELDTARITDLVSQETPLTLYPIFKSIGLHSQVELLLPNLGIAHSIPVVAAADSNLPLTEIIENALLDESSPGPFSLGFYSGDLEGIVDTSKALEEVTINISGDVTFESNSADLRDDAGDVLETVAEELSKYSSGGTLTITGYTDDIGSEQHNLELSRRRAQSVLTGLDSLLDLSVWEMTIAGEGESHPRVENDSDEHRAMNRRVELVANPHSSSEDASENSTAQDAASAGFSGNIGKGEDGVVVDIGNSQVSFTLPEVYRIGDYLVGEIQVSPKSQGIDALGNFDLPFPLSQRWGIYNTGGAFGFALVKDGTCYLAADFLVPDTDDEGEGVYLPLTTLSLAHVNGRSNATWPIIWPDIGQDSVAVSVLGNGAGSPTLTLTDVPVVEL